MVLADVDREGGEETAHLAMSEGADAVFVKADVRSASDVEAMVAVAVQTFGRLDIAFNNAGVLGSGAAMIDFTEDDWDDVMGINLKGVWLCMKHEIPAMIQVGRWCDCQYFLYCRGWSAANTVRPTPPANTAWWA